MLHQWWWGSQLWLADKVDVVTAYALDCLQFQKVRKKLTGPGKRWGVLRLRGEVSSSPPVQEQFVQHYINIDYLAMTLVTQIQHFRKLTGPVWSALAKWRWWGWLLPGDLLGVWVCKLKLPKAHALLKHVGFHILENHFETLIF